MRLSFRGLLLAGSAAGWESAPKSGDETSTLNQRHDVVLGGCTPEDRTPHAQQDGEGPFDVVPGWGETPIEYFT